MIKFVYFFIYFLIFFISINFIKGIFPINLLNNNILNKEIRGKRVIEEETLVKLFEEANSIESQPKGGMNENMNNHQLIDRECRLILSVVDA